MKRPIHPSSLRVFVSAFGFDNSKTTQRFEDYKNRVHGPAFRIVRPCEFCGEAEGYMKPNQKMSPRAKRIDPRGSARRSGEPAFWIIVSSRRGFQEKIRRPG